MIDWVRAAVLKNRAPGSIVTRSINRFGLANARSIVSQDNILTMDENGELTELSVRLAKLHEKSVSIGLQLRPGYCLLRRLPVPSLNVKEVESALALWAEESLPEPADSYYLHHWLISDQVRGLAALPRVPLQRARQTLLNHGLTVGSLHVPELCSTGDEGVSLVLRDTDHGTIMCLWQDDLLIDWQTFLPAFPDRALIELMAAVCPRTPSTIALDDATVRSNLRAELQACWPDAEIRSTGNSHCSAAQRRSASNVAFSSFVNEENQRPANRADRQTLALAMAAVAIAGVFLFFANVSRLQREVAQLQHEVSLLKVRATRSEMVAARSGEALTRVRELRAMTTERQGVMAVLKLLGDTLPPRTKLDNLAIERNGAIAMDGVAENELDVSTLLERIERTARFAYPNITYIQRDEEREDADTLVRFRLEAQLLQPLLALPGEEEASPSQTSATSG